MSSSRSGRALCRDRSGLGKRADVLNEVGELLTAELSLEGRHVAASAGDDVGKIVIVQSLNVRRTKIAESKPFAEW